MPMQTPPSTPNDNGDVLSIIYRNELAQRLRITDRTLRSWASKGVGPRFIKHNGTRGYYLARDVETWLNEAPSTCGANEAPGGRDAG